MGMIYEVGGDSVVPYRFLIVDLSAKLGDFIRELVRRI
jgi:hypothetical protein